LPFLSTLEALDLTPLLLELDVGGGLKIELEDEGGGGKGSSLDEDTTATAGKLLLLLGGTRLELLGVGSPGTRTGSGGSS
jgi:hypothetical protein